MDIQQERELRWRQAIEAGELGLWDLRPDLEAVHHSPQWKLRLGFPDPLRADSTHFWRCRVHPEDLDGMFAALKAATSEANGSYAAVFRLRSNGSGYRLVQSRGRAIEFDSAGRLTRMVGTMIDLTGRPSTPQGGLPDGHRGSTQGAPMKWPFHELLSAGWSEAGVADDSRSCVRAERSKVLNQMDDLLQESLTQLERRCAQVKMAAMR